MAIREILDRIDALATASAQTSDEAADDALAEAVGQLWRDHGHYSWWSGRAWAGSPTQDYVRAQGRHCETTLSGVSSVEVHASLAPNNDWAREVIARAFVDAVRGEPYRSASCRRAIAHLVPSLLVCEGAV